MITPTRQRWQLVLLLSLLGSAAEAKPAVAVLAFGGEGGDAARASLIPTLEKKYEVIPGQRLLDACDELGISMTRGENLARAAAHIGVVAVIGGSAKPGSLALAVYSGKTGDVLATGAVPLADSLGARERARALAILQRGLARAPRSMPRPKAPPPKTQGNDTLVFEPDPVNVSDGQRDDIDDNPLTKGNTTPTVVPSPDEGPVVFQKPKPPPPSGPPKAEATLGFGTWFRSFYINDPMPGMEHPKYTSGAAFALKLQLQAKPAAFFTQNFLANIYLRFRFQNTLGLESRTKQIDASGAEAVKMYGTVMREIQLDLGYDWKMLQPAWSPWLIGGLGFGITSFGISWDEGAKQSMPSSSYKYLMLLLGARFPFLPYLGAHLSFDYRPVFATGELEDDLWYGPASTGGLSFLLGLNGNWRKIIASLEYSYTRYFYSFTDIQDRLRVRSEGHDIKIAGGALDQWHCVMINAGYSY